MTYQINTPFCILPEGCYSSPDIGCATEDDRLFIVTNDVSVREALIEALNNKLEKRRKISSTMFNEILEDALTSLGQRNKQCDLAFLLMHPGGCLVAQMGRSRVLHISGANHEITYDSRNQIQDYSTKSRAEVIKDINDGDVIIITLSDRVDGHKLTQTVADYAGSDEFEPQINKALAVNRDSAPASYIITMRNTKGNMLAPLADVNWKWVLLYLLLAALIAGVAMLSLNGGLKLPKLFEDKPAAEASVDSVAQDTTARDSLIPALDVSTVAPEPVEKPKKDTVRVEKPKPEESKVEEPTSPGLRESVPVEPELKVDAPEAPTTPPPTPED
ncbi:MAG: hypothetical protein IKX39_05365 [Muribaculaceae bacterium]|nr:hypothetical protein [Muribaculaceae bacterium]